MTSNPTPDFTSPIAGRIEVREPCPWCPDRPMVPRSLMDDHCARLHPDVQVVSAVDQTTRDRIAEAIHRDLLAHRARRDQGLLGIVPRLADAVMVVLRGLTLRELELLYRPNTTPSRPKPKTPPPADRAAVLREAADELGRMDYDTDSNDYGYDTYRDAWNGGVMDGADLLRRLADEAQQPAVGARQPDTETPGLPYTHTDDDADTLQIGTVMASTYDGEAPVVFLNVQQHQGDDQATVYVRPERVEEVVTALRAAGRVAAASAVPGRSAATSTDEETSRG